MIIEYQSPRSVAGYDIVSITSVITSTHALTDPNSYLSLVYTIFAFPGSRWRTA